MTWIFQGNPAKFDIDDYLARYPELIYWFTPKLATRISVGDRAYIWRSGSDAGAIAVGTVVEAPCPGRMVKHPEALGADLWQSGEPDPDAVRTGIRLDEIRLSTAEGMVSRATAKADPVFGSASIITMPNATVFSLSTEQASALGRLWGGLADPVVETSLSATTEGARKLVSHFRRERSASLRRSKIAELRANSGKCVCALCGISESDRYPAFVAERIFEVHHLSPLARAASPVCTTLADLALLCASCHRATHATPDVEANYAALHQHFRGKS